MDRPARNEEIIPFRKAPADPPVIVSGRVGSKNVENICLDPGASRTFEHSRWIPEASYTGEQITVKTINPGNEQYKLADVTAEVAGQEVDLEVAAHPQL